MDDLTITRLCAEAMGFEFDTHDSLPFYWGNGHRVPYNPRQDDAQAMALVKRFGLSISAHGDSAEIGDHWRVKDYSGRETIGLGRSGSSLNRAICECVAKMRESTPNPQPPQAPYASSG
jgi:hypothetical protein